MDRPLATPNRPFSACREATETGWAAQAASGKSWLSGYDDIADEQSQPIAVERRRLTRLAYFTGQS
jgi:hypothetical protein